MLLLNHVLRKMINHKYQLQAISLLTGFYKLFELLTFHCLKHNLVSNNNLEAGQNPPRVVAPTEEE